MQTILHVSDIHAGAPFRPDLAELVHFEADELNPDVVVVSGDTAKSANLARHAAGADLLIHEVLAKPLLQFAAGFFFSQDAVVAQYEALYQSTLARR